jgi:hypothetical protein
MLGEIKTDLVHALRADVVARSPCQDPHPKPLTNLLWNCAKVRTITAAELACVYKLTFKSRTDQPILRNGDVQ